MTLTPGCRMSEVHRDPHRGHAEEVWDVVMDIERTHEWVTIPAAW